MTVRRLWAVLIGMLLVLMAGLVVVPTAQAAGLSPGQTLAAGQSVTSDGGGYRLTMQTDGNLVLYGPAGARWSTGTVRSGADRAVMQGDGNVVVYRGSAAVWASGTNGVAAGGSLVVQDDGNVVLYAGGGAVWSTWTGLIGRPGDTLTGGQELTAGESLTSPDGAYRAIMQGDGNLVVHGPAGVVWHAGTRGAGARAVFQSDGNLVVYSGARALWNAGVPGFGGDRVVLQNDGNLVLYAGGRALWSSRTGVARQLQPLNLLIPAGTCGAGAEDEAWDQPRPIQLVNGSGAAFDADLNGAAIFDSRHLGNVDVNGDGIHEIVLAIDCSGTPLHLCCASRASVMTFVVALDVSGPTPTRVGDTIVPGIHDDEQYDIVAAHLAGTAVVTTQRAVYQDTWQTRQVTYRYTDGQWMSS